VTFDNNTPTGPPPHDVEGVPVDTNPVHCIDETYEDYCERIRAAGLVVPASDAEWANAVPVECSGGTLPTANCALEVTGAAGTWGLSPVDDPLSPDWSADVQPPANFASIGFSVTAFPSAAWTYVGDHMILGDGSHTHWDGAAWVAGDAGE
jgi:hypothetical protein